MNLSFKIAFIHLDDIHHVYHFVGPAVELAKSVKVDIYTFPGKHEILYKTINKLGGNPDMVKQLGYTKFQSFVDTIKNRNKPRAKLWVKYNIYRLLKEKYDAFVFIDFKQNHFLKYAPIGSLPKLIILSHGVAGRAYAFKKDILDFDLYLASGIYPIKRLKDSGWLTMKYALIGYPKFDVLPPLSDQSFFVNENPIVLYNPHFEKELGSWRKKGIEVLEYFYNNTEFNLLFAPHNQLFCGKDKAQKSEVPKKYFKVKNIFIDLGSERSIDMTYTRLADIYLGDISSQVYEFLFYKPSPCIFINTHKDLNYKKDENYRFWRCGPVINEMANFKVALEKAKNQNYKSIQEKITSENFSLPVKGNSSQKVAAEILKFLKDNR